MIFTNFIVLIYFIPSMDEVKVYLDNPTCKVTSKYLIINGQKYKLADINGVFVTKQVNNRRYPVFIGILGLIISLSTDSMFGGIVSLVIILAALVFMYYSRVI